MLNTKGLVLDPIGLELDFIEASDFSVYAL